MPEAGVQSLITVVVLCVRDGTGTVPYPLTSYVALPLKILHKLLKNRLRNIASHNILPAIGTHQPFDKTGTDLGNLSRGHQKDRSNRIVQIAIDIAHPAFKLIVALRANTPHNIICANTACVIDQKLIFVTGDNDIIELRRGLTKQIEPSPPVKTYSLYPD